MTPEQIAAEVSARYGIPVAPAAVKIIPQGQMATHVQYVWNGRELKTIDPQENPIRRAMNAQYKNRKAGEKIAKAPKPRTVHPQVLRSQERQALTLQLIAQGYTTADLAAHFNTAPKTMRKFLNKWGMKANPPPRTPRKSQKAIDRLARVQAFTEAGDKTIRQIADFLGIGWKAAQSHCHKHGIPYRTKFQKEAA